ncbi:hypothetical protein [Rhodopirellula baltica]
MMTDAARAAFNELTELGAEPIDWGEYAEGETHIAFGLSTEVKKDGRPIFVDYRGETIVEQLVRGEWHNPSGVRQDVHEILRRHHLVSDWQDHVIRCVYNDPYCPGRSHDDTFSTHHIGAIARGMFEFTDKPTTGYTHDDIRRMTFEKCEAMAATHPNQPIYWQPLSEDEKLTRIEAAVPEGDYHEKFDELDADLRQFRTWTWVR